MKIVIFTFMLNIGAGLLSALLENEINSPLRDMGLAQDQVKVPMGYDPTTADFNQTSAGAISLPSIEGNQNWFIRILDYFQLGIFIKIIAIFNQFVFGFVGIFQSLGLIDPVYAGILYFVQTLIYGLGLFELITGRNLVET